MTSVVEHPAGGRFEPALVEPMRRVFELGRAQLPVGVAIGLIGAMTVHGFALAKGVMSLFELAMFSERVHQVVLERQRAAYDIDMSEKKRPPEPDPEPEPEKNTAKPTQRSAEPPPAPAQAAKVLTADKDPNEPEDFTDEGFVTGDGEKYAGGTTTSAGTSKSAVQGPVAKKGGVEGGKGTTPVEKPTAGAGPDSSKPAVPQSRNWNCGFPPEADFDQIDYATVMISVTVGTDGRAKSVNVISDPGHGFGRLAKSCAMRMQYNVGLDKDGNPVAKTTSPFPVRFTR